MARLRGAALKQILPWFAPPFGRWLKLVTGQTESRLRLPRGNVRLLRVRLSILGAIEYILALVSRAFVRNDLSC